MKPSRPSAFTRFCSALVAVTLTLQPLGSYAAIIAGSVLAETPLQGTNPVKPNIMFTLDDSESMILDYLPDYTGDASGRGYCRDGQDCKKIVPGPIPIFTPPARSSGFNRQYYDPAASYVPGKTASGLDMPCEGADVTCGAPWTSVYANGFANYPGANLGGTTNLITGYPDTIYCNSLVSSTPPAASDIATAYGDGTICRLNGRAYAALPVAGGLTVPKVDAGYNYPNRIGNLTTFASTVCNPGEVCVFGVPFVGSTVTGNPYYYTISKIQFCSNVDPVTGFGTPPCQDRQDPTTSPPYKYVRYGTDPAKSFDPQAFTRVDILPTGFLVNGVAAASPTGRSPAAEMANFAKWYAFDRTRMLAMKTAAGRAFSTLDETNARIGLHTLAENATAFQNVAPFDPTQKAAWFTKFYGLTPPSGAATPLPDAAVRIGEYFTQGGSSGLPGATSPMDPTTGQCQSNYHLMATDGYWNVSLPPGTVGNKDGTLTVAPPAPVPGFTPGSPLPRPYYEGPTTSGDSLADIAMKYWITDLQPGLADSVPDAVAPWQHLTLYGVSIGAQGNIVYPNGVDAIKSGAQDWPVPTGAGNPDSIDDLWHAALNSRGKFFNASSPQQLAESIVSALADFIGPDGTGTAVGIAGAQLTASKSYGYRTSYDSKWSGDVKKYALDPTTGALPSDPAGNPLNPAVWSAQVQLDAQVASGGWDTNRRIVTMNDSGGAVPFRLGNLSGPQAASLTAGWALVTPAPTAQQIVDYLRGDSSNEGVGTTNFRARSHALGDIVYSGAVPVGAPGEPYDDTGNPGFTSFASSKASRTPMVYVGGNDGMMHAFNDSTGTDGGKEAWAYVPRALFSVGDPNDTGHAASPAFSIGALTFRQGGIPLFNHKFYVNATPRVWNIDVANTDTSSPPTTGNDWRTLLVGGLGAGGRAVFALDVTNPVELTDTESTAASRALWEFTDANMGNVFDAPTLVKTRAFGWVVLVASGYNNPGGKGFLYVLNPANGALLKKLDLPLDPGSDANPTGLSTVRAFTSSRKDPYVLQAYSGDLHGNVWRFDLSDPSAANWKTELIARLTDPSGKEQPITTGVRVEIDQNNNVDRYLFVGTGKLLGPSDIADTSVINSVYVIRDGTRTAAEAAPTTPYSRSDLNTVTAGVAGFSGPATGRGWYQDATDPSEKIGVDVYADVQTVVYAFSRQNPDPCLGILTSRLYARDLNSGASTLEDAGAGVVASVDIGPGIAGIALIQSVSGSSSAAGDVRVQVTTMKGQVFSFGVKLAGGLTLRHRVSWRLLNRE